MSEIISSDTETLILTAQKNVQGLIDEVFHHTDEEHAVVVYDLGSVLSKVLSEAYKYCLPDATFFNFEECSHDEILEALASLQESDFVVLIQSTNFRLNAFRIRVELFKRKIKVLEHPHLGRMADEEAPVYIDALAYDAEYYRGVGHALQTKIDAARSGVLDSGGELLVYDSSFEPAKLNIGDYEQMTNTGGQFPIGEVFTEAKDLRALNGRAKIAIFSDVTYRINKPQIPITLIIQKGQVVGCENSTPEFDEILSLIREGEDVVWVRELGFGLNKAFSTNRTVKDTGSYERMCGVHLSLGAKHGMYGKEGFKRGDGKFHIDVFADTHSFTLDDEVIYQDGAWTVHY